MNITDYILSKTNRLTVSPEISPGDHGFSMFNDAGTEVEVSELLYSLTKVVKPKLLLETGTHIGVSSTYLAQGIKENNNGGKLITFEIIPVHLNNAKLLWQEVGVDHLIEGRLQSALDFEPRDMEFDMLFLDSEPQLRFNEFVKFWPNLKPGGIVAIHDLHPSMGHHGQVYHGEYDWPYGDFRVKLGPFIKNHQVQVIHPLTPRGLSIFQKTRPGFEVTKYLVEGN